MAWKASKPDQIVALSRLYEVRWSSWVTSVSCGFNFFEPDGMAKHTQNQEQFILRWRLSNMWYVLQVRDGH